MVGVCLKLRHEITVLLGKWWKQPLKSWATVFSDKPIVLGWPLLIRSLRLLIIPTVVLMWLRNTRALDVWVSYGAFLKWRYLLPHNGWFMANPMKIDDDWGYPLFQETTIWKSLWRLLWCLVNRGMSLGGSWRHFQSFPKAWLNGWTTSIGKFPKMGLPPKSSILIHFGRIFHDVSSISGYLHSYRGLSSQPVEGPRRGMSPVPRRRVRMFGCPMGDRKGGWDTSTG